MHGVSFFYKKQPTFVVVYLLPTPLYSTINKIIFSAFCLSLIIHFQNITNATVNVTKDFFLSFFIKKTLKTVLLIAIPWLSYAQFQPFPEALSARNSSYEMQIKLDTKKHQVKATQTVTFINPSDDTIWTMPFHLYYNAFKNNKSTFNTSASRIPISKPQSDIDNGVWGWIKVTNIQDKNGNDLTQNSKYVQYDDGNKNDHTVLEVQLKTPILPRATYQLEMQWQSQIPKLFIRTGYNKDFYFMAQWYPKLGVYEPAGSRFAIEGAWNCHQYHPSTEYFGEFGVYKIALDVPSNYTVGASGFLLKKEEKDNRTVHTYLAEDVIDFTWSANPDFVEVIKKWKGVTIRLLIRPEHEHYQNRFLDAAGHALEFFESYIEKYPYPTLTIVSPPFYGLAAGAMEYPTLITAPTMSGFPMGIRTTETLTIHELTHQYFMQMLATNEQEEPWMDEGFTAFFEAKIMDKYYPDGVVSLDYWNIHILSSALRRGRFLAGNNIKSNAVSDLGWMINPENFSQIVYGKTAIWLQTLEGLVGEKVMKEIIQTYFSRWKFKHPGRQDFIDIVNEVIPKHYNQDFTSYIDSFLKEAIFGTNVCDYAVHSIENKRVEASLGFFKNTENALTPTEDLGEINYESQFTLYRLGEFIIPQEVAVTFDNGDVELTSWDGKSRTYNAKYEGSRQIVSVEIDPNFKIPLDKNLINNSYTVTQQSTGITSTFTSMVSWLQHTMVSLSVLL